MDVDFGRRDDFCWKFLPDRENSIGDDRVDFFATSLAIPLHSFPNLVNSNQQQMTGVSDRDKGPQEADYLKEPERR